MSCKLAVQGHLSSIENNYTKIEGPFLVHDKSYISFYQDIHNHYGVFDSNKTKIQISPEIYLKDFKDPDSKARIIMHQNDLFNLYSLIQKVNI